MTSLRIAPQIAERNLEPNIINLTSERRPVPDGYTEVRKGSMPSATRHAVHTGELVGYLIERRLCVKTADHLEWIERTRRVLPKKAAAVGSDPRDHVKFGSPSASRGARRTGKEGAQ